MHVVVGYRSMTVGNYRDIITLSKIDVCRMNDSNAFIGALREEVNFYNSQLGYPWKPCPWKTIEALNGSLSFPENISYEEAKKLPRLMPNGEYRVNIRLFNDRDNNIITIRFIITLKVFTNEDPF